MERRPEAAPKSLAQLIARRGRAPRSGWPAAEPTVDALGQFGLLFTEPVPPVEEEISEPVVEQAAARKLWSVAELVGVLRGRLERDYSDIWVEGEISNAKLAASGGYYFTLKDGDAQLPAVLFRRQVALLKWKPADGMAVLARGRVSVFEPRGQLQLIAESLEPRGAGALQLQFEQLKARLRDEGLFDPARKRPLPAYPGTIGVVTSTQGAVIRDIVTVCRRRHGCMNILVYPAAVQGANAAAELLAGVHYFNDSTTHRVDVIVVARGGGSTEDLWAFNDEALARAIAASKLPVVSAVGHETDFTIADFVADLRAPTPSAAAELITEAQHRAEERVDALRARLLRGVRWQAMSARQRFARVSAAGALRRVPELLDRRIQRVDALQGRLARAATATHEAQVRCLDGLRNRMLRQDARSRIASSRALLHGTVARLERIGFTLPGNARTQLVETLPARLARAIEVTHETRVRRVDVLRERALRQHPGHHIAASRSLLQGVATRLERAGLSLQASARTRVERATVRLQALSPTAVLERGYALAFAADGSLLRSTRQAETGTAMTVRLADGAVLASIFEVRAALPPGEKDA